MATGTTPTGFANQTHIHEHKIRSLKTHAHHEFDSTPRFMLVRVMSTQQGHPCPKLGMEI